MNSVQVSCASATQSAFGQYRRHPEAYDAVKKLLSELGIEPEKLREGSIPVRIEDYAKMAEKLSIGEITLHDIVHELRRPGRDPREDMPKPVLRTDVLEMKDLKPGMILKAQSEMSLIWCVCGYRRPSGRAGPHLPGGGPVYPPPLRGGAGRRCGQGCGPGSGREEKTDLLVHAPGERVLTTMRKRRQNLLPPVSYGDIVLD